MLFFCIIQRCDSARMLLSDDMNREVGFVLCVCPLALRVHPRSASIALAGISAGFQCWGGSFGGSAVPEVGAAPSSE